MSWDKVGEWIKDNAGGGAALIGSLLTGNIPGAIAAGVSLVSDATGSNEPQKALMQLKQDPQVLVRLEELAQQERNAIRAHIEQMEMLRLQDVQAEHQQTQETIRAGDGAEDAFVRRTRPAQSWLSLIAAIVYVFYTSKADEFVLGALLALPFAYAGLRGFDKFSALRAMVRR